MTTAAFNLIYDNTSDATYRTWCTAIDTQILAMGWVHSTDTGQANLATMTRTATFTTNYTVYKTNDGVSPPIILRIEWSNGATGQPGMSLQVGFATDGAGNISGTAASGRWTMSTSTTSDTVARTCIMSGSTSRLAFALNMNATATPNSSILSLERSKNSAGADTNTGAIFIFYGGASGNNVINGVIFSSAPAMLYIPTAGGVPGIEKGIACVLTNNSAANNNFGGVVGAGIPVPLAGAAQNPGLGMLICLPGEMPTRDTTISATMQDGSSHTYYSLGPNWVNFAAIGGTLVLSRGLLRYE